MAYTGDCMLTGTDFFIFLKYIDKIMKRHVFMCELELPEIQREIREKSAKDFLKLCLTAEREVKPW